ncbi:hypothetical protein [Gardnerella vaginalis]|uniref:hypothetical protein n=2 Tax=Gardnerella vaginalis TaxID=2702 RepID=UPI0039EDF5E5
MKNQHSTQPTHATRRHHANNHTGTAQTSHQTEYHTKYRTSTTSNVTLQDNRTQLTSRVCSLFDPFGKQKQEHLPEIVYVFGDFGNKHGIKETKTGESTTSRLKRSARGALTELEIA